MPAYWAMKDLNAPPPGQPSMSIPHGMDLSGVSGRVPDAVVDVSVVDVSVDVSVGEFGGWWR